MNLVRNYLSLFLKGVAMGAANVIPGVSGGTIAFITGIYEKLIISIKSFDLHALKLVFKGDLKGFVQHTNLFFLVAIFSGVGVSILSLARLLEFLIVEFEVLTMAFFFGLIFASVIVVGKLLKKWDFWTIGMLVAGTVIAIAIGFLSPSTENSNALYVFICGIIAVCSMILPGLSGSYILLIMGNYLLVLGAIRMLDFRILMPLLAGCVLGLLGFSHLLAYLLKKFHNETVALLTGFILGSLYLIWPWKHTIYYKNAQGQYITRENGELIVEGYRHFLPLMDLHFVYALLLAAIGVILVLLIERLGSGKSVVQE